VQQKPPLSTTFLGHETDKGITGTGTSGVGRTYESFIYHYDCGLATPQDGNGLGHKDRRDAGSDLVFVI